MNTRVDRTVVLALAAVMPAALSHCADGSASAPSPERIELAVQSGLEYIVAKQRPDGSFVCDKYPTAVTGLACLAIMANRDDKMMGKYTTALDKGIVYILKQQADNGTVGTSNLY
ncbi:unnamed protein product, partial [marine sediment metagenome]